ncbi:MAG: polysaccharide biosynthesis/export family protein [Terrimicrobiaceae bacterium]|nr:polysaccharide biosynthesis/export family protein [Terrimicrobiaceae bacterium]
MKRIKILCAALLLVPSFALAQDAALRAGDQVEIRLGGVPGDEVSAVTGIYTVDGEGSINLPHIGKVRAAGMTQSQLQTAIEGAYKGQQIYTNPSITVAVPTSARFVDVGGDVRGPQRVPFTPDLTVLGAINAAGGFSEYANQSKVRLLRDNQVITVDVKEIRRDPSRDLKLRPGDKIEVPRSFW